MWALIAIRINHCNEKVVHIARIFDEYDEASEMCDALNADKDEIVFKYFLKNIKLNKHYDEEDWWS